MDLAILALIILAFAGGNGGADNSTSDGEGAPEPPPEGLPEPGGGPQLDRAQVEQMASELGLDAQWGRFLAAVAAGESDFVTCAINRGDAGAARAAWNRNAEHYEGCANPERYQDGSLGLYQMLPANALKPLWDTPLVCIDPVEALCDPMISTILAVDYARRVMRWSNWGRSPKTWAALRHGWRSPGLTDADRPDIDARMRAQLKRIGIPESFMQEKVTPLPSGWDAAELVAQYVTMEEA